MQAERTLAISDNLKNNGKDAEGFIDFDMHFHVRECKIRSGLLYINDALVDLNKIKSVILNFNEVAGRPNRRKGFRSDHTFFKQIAELIKGKYPNIIIYNDPHRCADFGDKLKVYDKIKYIHHEIFSVPEYRSIRCAGDIEAVNFFPNIIKVTDGSHSKRDSLCHNEQELRDNYNKKFKDKKNVFCVEYINSYIDSLDSYCSVRFMIFNNELVDYFFRPSDNWNVHTSDQNVEKIYEADIFFKEFLEANRDSINHDLDKLHATYGNGFFAHDLVLSNDRLYICELGLKVFDLPYYTFMSTCLQRRRPMPSLRELQRLGIKISIALDNKLGLNPERLQRYFIEKITK